MAKEQVASQALVLPNANEELMEKLRNMRLNRQKAKPQEDLEEYVYEFREYFESLSYSFFDLSEEQLRELSIDEIRALDKFIIRKARPWMICQMIFTFCVPIVGWYGGSSCFADGTFESWNYFYYRSKLVKVCGENFLDVLKP